MDITIHKYNFCIKWVVLHTPNSYKKLCDIFYIINSFIAIIDQILTRIKVQIKLGYLVLCMRSNILVDMMLVFHSCAQIQNFFISEIIVIVSNPPSSSSHLPWMIINKNLLVGRHYLPSLSEKKKKKPDTSSKINRWALFLLIFSYTSWNSILISLCPCNTKVIILLPKTQSSFHFN